MTFDTGSFLYLGMRVWRVQWLNCISQRFQWCYVIFIKKFVGQVFAVELRSFEDPNIMQTTRTGLREAPTADSTFLAASPSRQEGKFRKLDGSPPGSSRGFACASSGCYKGFIAKWVWSSGYVCAGWVGVSGDADVSWWNFWGLLPLASKRVSRHLNGLVISIFSPVRGRCLVSRLGTYFLGTFVNDDKLRCLEFSLSRFLASFI